MSQHLKPGFPGRVVDLAIEAVCRGAADPRVCGVALGVAQLSKARTEDEVDVDDAPRPAKRTQEATSRQAVRQASLQAAQRLVELYRQGIGVPNPIQPGRQTARGLVAAGAAGASLYAGRSVAAGISRHLQQGGYGFMKFNSAARLEVLLSQVARRRMRGPGYSGDIPGG